MAKAIQHYTNKKKLKRLTLKEGDKVYLLYKNIKTKQLNNKLNYKKIKLFYIIEKLLKVNFRLLLFKTYRYTVFYILLLEPVPANTQLVI